MKRSTCVYLIRDGKWLMLLRDRKKDDVNHGKWIGVGGKCLSGESFEACAIRETKEETGLTIMAPKFRGFLEFRYETLEPEQIAVYTAEEFSGEEAACDEGTLAWIEEEKILDLELWEGDRLFLKRLLSNDASNFEFLLEYDDQGNLINAEERKGDRT